MIGTKTSMFDQDDSFETVKEAANVVDHLFNETLLLLRAIYEFSGHRGDRVVRDFRSSHFNACMRLKVFEMKEGDIEEI